MKKLIFTICLLPTSLLAGNFYFGGSVGSTFSTHSAQIGINDNTDQEYIKKSFKNGNILNGGAFFGYEAKVGQGRMFFEGKLSINNEKDSQKAVGDLGDVEAGIKRPKNFGMSIGYATSSPIEGLDMFVKASFLISQFQVHLRDIERANGYAGSVDKTLLGFAPGFGVQTSVADDYSIGIGYSYHMYQRLDARTVNVPLKATYSLNMKPRYHVIEAFIARKF